MSWNVDGNSPDRGSGPSWIIRIGLPLVVFAATAAVVWSSGTERPSPAVGCFAVATIVETEPPTSVPDDRPRTRTVDREQIAGQITSPSNLRRVLEQIELAVPDDGPFDPIDRLRRELEVTVTEATAPNRLEITIGCPGQDPDHVARLVNVLAENYAQDRRAAAEESFDRAWRQAVTEADDALRTLVASRTRLDGFLSRHFEEHRSRAEELRRLEVETPPEEAPSPVAGTTIEMIDNPEWVELDRQRKQLVGFRSELLATRMPHHPVVREVDVKLAELSEAMAQVSEQIPDEGHPIVVARPMIDTPPMPVPPDGPTETSPSTLDRRPPGEVAEEHQQAVAEYLALQASVDEARQTHDRLAESERDALGRRLAMPTIELRPAQPYDLPGPAGGSGQLILAALISGLGLAAAASMIATGFGTDPTFETAAEAQAALPVPIVGAVSVGSDVTDEPSRLEDTSSGRTMAAWGVALAVVIVVLSFIYLL